MTPDPHFLYMSERHREGLAHLLYGVQQPGGFVQLTGEVGSGKTTLCRCLIKQLPENTDVALVLNPRLTAIELLANICDELRISYPPEASSIKALVDALNRHLLEAHAKGRRTVLIIDEAQNLDSDVLEQVRLLTNLESSREKLLQIILIGQPELLTLLNGKGLRQLSQRITARYHLQALSKRETYAYIQHRLLVAGRRDPLFTGRAMHCVYRVSRGVPRIINVVCDRALLGAYAQDKKRIDASIVRRAARETQGLVSLYRRLRRHATLGIAALAILAIGAAIFLIFARPSFFGRNSASLNAEVSSSLADPQPIHLSAQERSVSAAGVASVDSNGSGRRGMADGFADRSRLIDMLGDVSLGGDEHSGFAGLFAAWGIHPVLNSSQTGCEAARVNGMECLYQEGSWLKLRRYGIPAILETVLPDGTRRDVAIVGLGDDRAVLMIGKQPRFLCPKSMAFGTVRSFFSGSLRSK